MREASAVVSWAVLGPGSEEETVPVEARRRQQSHVDGVGCWQQEHCDIIELLCELGTSAEGKDISCEVTIDVFTVESIFVLEKRQRSNHQRRPPFHVSPGGEGVFFKRRHSRHFFARVWPSCR